MKIRLKSTCPYCGHENVSIIKPRGEITLSAKQPESRDYPEIAVRCDDAGDGGCDRLYVIRAALATCVRVIEARKVEGEAEANP